MFSHSNSAGTSGGVMKQAFNSFVILAVIALIVPLSGILSKISADPAKLDAPTNPKWDAEYSWKNAEWDPVDNAKSYLVYLWVDYTGNGYLDDLVTSVTTTNTYYDFGSFLLYKNYKYMFSVIAQAPSYDSSDEAICWEFIPGEYSLRDITSSYIQNDDLYVDFTDDNGLACDINVEVYSESGVYLFSERKTSCKGNIDLRNIFAYNPTYSTQYGKYMISLTAYVYPGFIDGQEFVAGVTQEPLVYNYRQIDPVDKLELDVEPPQILGSGYLYENGFSLESYIGSRKYNNAISYYSSSPGRYIYKDSAEDDWHYFTYEDYICKGKYAYGFEMNFYSVRGYKISDDLKVYVDGSSEGVSTTVEKDPDFDSWEIKVVYTYPDGFEPYGKIDIGYFHISGISDGLFDTDFTYTGKPITPDPTITCLGKTLVKGEDYTIYYKDNVDAGEGRMLIYAFGDYEGDESYFYNIVPAPIDTAVVDGIKDVVYSGSAVTQDLKVKLDLAGTMTTLVKDKDYTVSYKNNNAAGTATVTITGKGNYTGSVSKTFKITKPTPTPAKKPTPTPAKKPAATATATATATPTVNPIRIKLNKTKDSVVCGKKISLKATVTGTDKTVTWKSSDKKIATVDSNGKITAKQAGTVTITAQVAGKKSTCKVTVLYKDVSDSKDFWFTPTNYLTASGVVKGYDKQTNFKPSNNCTRAQMVTFLWRLAGEPEPKSKSTSFDDVKSKDYFFKPVIWAVENGITTGVSKKKFAPQNLCTRAQTVTFLWRMAGKPAPRSTTNKFKDINKKDYFYNAVLWASENNIVAGYSGGKFKPQGNCLRRQMVTFLYKYDKNVLNKEK